MAPTKKRNVSSENPSEVTAKRPKTDLHSKVEEVLESRKNANEVFDILECLQVCQHLTFYYNITNRWLLANISASKSKQAVVANRHVSDVSFACLLVSLTGLSVLFTSPSSFTVGEREGCCQCYQCVLQTFLHLTGEKRLVHRRASQRRRDAEWWVRSSIWSYLISVQCFLYRFHGYRMSTFDFYDRFICGGDPPQNQTGTHHKLSQTYNFAIANTEQCFWSCTYTVVSTDQLLIFSAPA